MLLPMASHISDHVRMCALSGCVASTYTINPHHLDVIKCESSRGQDHIAHMHDAAATTALYVTTNPHVRAPATQGNQRLAIRKPESKELCAG